MADRLSPPIDSPAAWEGARIQSSLSWHFRLGESAVTEICEAVAFAKRSGKTVGTLTRDDFPLPTLASDVLEWSRVLDRGLGFILIRGFPVESLGPDASLGYLGLGLHLGTPVPQNTSGELLCEVRDYGVPRTGPEVRRYMTRDKQDFHTDGADVIGLLCIRRAKSGGLSRIVSSLSIYNEIGRVRPDLIPLLYDPMCFEGEFLFELPICSVHRGRLRTFYIGWYIRDAQRNANVPRLTVAQQELLDIIEKTANDPNFYLDMDFEPGDIQFLNNATILHARTAYEDVEEPEKKRCLLRLWLTPHEFSSVEEGLSGGIRAG